MGATKITSKFLPPSQKSFEEVSKFMFERNQNLAEHFHRFMWRYRLARSFKQIEADEEMGKTTLLGYSEGMRLFLAYSAYDEIRDAELIFKGLKGEDRIRHQVTGDIRLNAEIRSLDKLKETLLKADSVIKGDGNQKLKPFYAKDSNDVMVVATHFRNLFVHGDMTAAGAGLTNAKKRKIITDLSNLVLSKADEISDTLIREYIKSKAAELITIKKQNNKNGRKTLVLKSK
jgi:hypothetical protein